MNLTKFLKGSAILLLFSSFVISCHDNDVIEKEEDNQDPDTEESINLALGKTVETRINSITGSGSNTEKANLMTDGDLTTYWESADSYKLSIHELHSNVFLESLPADNIHKIVFCNLDLRKKEPTDTASPFITSINSHLLCMYRASSRL